MQRPVERRKERVGKKGKINEEPGDVLQMCLNGHKSSRKNGYSDKGQRCFGSAPTQSIGSTRQANNNKTQSQRNYGSQENAQLVLKDDENAECHKFPAGAGCPSDTNSSQQINQ